MGGHDFDDLSDICVKCGLHLKDSHDTEVGCLARGINPHHYTGLALTAAEQQAAADAGIALEEAHARKLAAIFGPGESLTPREVVRRREPVERAALSGHLPPPRPSTSDGPSVA